MMDRAFIGSSSTVGMVTQFVGSRVATRASVDVGPLDVTNVQKLSLSPSTPVGTRVSVSDGFIENAFGFFYADGTHNSKPAYEAVSYDETTCKWSGSQWEIRDQFGEVAYSAPNDVAFPWLVPNEDWVDALGNGPERIVHPAIQTLAAPSSAQGGVAVLGTGNDAICTIIGQQNGKNQFQTLDGSGLLNVYWSLDLEADLGATGAGHVVGWALLADAGDIIYSLSDTLTPDLATNWKNASDDSPASITVTSVSIGEIYAGLFVSNDGATNGSSYVSQPFHGRQYYIGLNGGGSNNMHWDTDFNVWTDDVGVWTTDNVAFPWQGRDNGGGGHTGATFAINHVANERNWVNS